MPHQTQWHAGGRIIHVKYIESITLQEMGALIRFFKPHFDSVDYPIHLIVDYSAEPQMGVSLREALQSEEARTQFQHPNVEWVVYVTDEKWHYFYLYASMFEKHLDAKTQAIRTLEAALAFLQKQDDTLDLGGA